MDRLTLTAAVAAAGAAAYAGVRLAQRRGHTAAAALSLGVSGSEKQWLILVRHGDRHDYSVGDSWSAKIKRLGGRARDPPLSALGHRQAAAFGRAAAAAVAERGGSVRVRTSPYLRCLQTSMPLCDLVDAPLEVEPRAAEIHHKVANYAPYGERFAYFPRLVDAEDPTVEEEDWPVGYMERIGRFGAELTSELDDELDAPGTSTTVVTSHAASVALVAWLLDVELTPELKFAPAGCYVLARNAKSEPWRLLRSGDNNAPYVSENSKTTFPWGYKPEYLQKWAGTHRATYPAPTRR